MLSHSSPVLRLLVAFLQAMGIGVALGSRRNAPPILRDSANLKEGGSSLTRARDLRGQADGAGGVLSARLLLRDSIWICMARSCSTAGDVPFKRVDASAMVFNPTAEAQRAVLSNISVPEYKRPSLLGSRPASDRVVDAPNEGAKRFVGSGSAFFGLRPRSTKELGGVSTEPPMSSGAVKERDVATLNTE